MPFAKTSANQAFKYEERGAKGSPKITVVRPEPVKIPVQNKGK